MSVIATINIGANGATTLGGQSKPLSTPADRARFLALHHSAGSIILGRNSLQSESYQGSKAKLFVFTRKRISSDRDSETITYIDSSHGLKGAMQKVIEEGAKPILVEAGPTLIFALVKVGCIDELYLSISPIDGDGNFLSISKLLKSFEVESEETVESTRLLKCRYKSDSPNS